MKHMKKSLFLTTVMMVVLLIVALSTATFAWYTAQSNATASLTTITSATSSAASLGVDTANNGASSTKSVVDLVMTSGIYPMVPLTAPTAATLYSAFSADFRTATKDNEGNFSSVPSNGSPATIATADVLDGTPVTQNFFYTVNTNKDNPTGIQAKITISDHYTLTTVEPANWVTSYASYYTLSDGVYTALTATTTWAADTFYTKDGMNDKLRVALFADDLYIGTWGDGQIYYGTIVNGSPTSSISTSYAATASGNNLTVDTNVAALGGVRIQLVAWYEGDLLNVAQAGLSANFAIEFSLIAAV